MPDTVDGTRSRTPVPPPTPALPPAPAVTPVPPPTPARTRTPAPTHRVGAVAVPPRHRWEADQDDVPAAADAERWHHRLLPPPYRLPVTVTFLTSLLLCVGFLALPLAGTDLSAQVARGHFFDEHGFVPIDFRWYGGIYPFGYSALTGPLNALLGSRGVGAVSCVVSAVAFAWLLARVGARRPAVGGVLGAVVGVFNLVSGRTTFAMGIAFGMLALCALVLPGVSPRWRWVIAGVLAALSSAGSPVAGVFTGLAGGALWLTGRRPEGWALAIGSGLALLPPVFLFRDGGVQPYSDESMKVSVAISVAVFFLVPARLAAVRAGALLAGLLAVVAFYVPNPMGSNAIRLPMLFAAPVVVAVSPLDRRVLAGVVAVLSWWQPPLVAGDLGHAGTREASRLYYQPLIKQLEKRGPIGRIEVVPLRDHWESTYVADAVPIVRGWERQVDVERNALFYNGTLDPATYLEWLYHNAVEYVAVPRDAKLDSAGRGEAALIEANLRYLKKVWENGDWQVYRVVGGPTMVEYPGRLVESGPTGVRFESPIATELTVRVRWSPWLTLQGGDGCIEQDEEWVKVRLNRAGSYRLTGTFWFPQRTHC